MSLGNNRDYKTNARRVTTNLKRHYELMTYFETNYKITREEASKKAFDAMNQGLTLDTIKIIDAAREK
jgi:hypothetical protein